MRSLLVRWIIGGMVGTSIIATSSPLFVRSYLPRTYDSVRQVLVPQSGNYYRWRSEGYASTFIGPHGMPGQRDIPVTDGNKIRLAIWGDSQAEGVCVEDDGKLYAQIERAAESELTAFPFARSGDDASDWLRQIPRVEQALEIDVHVLLVVELGDLVAATESHEESEEAPSKFGFVETLPAFVIESVRRLATDANDQTRKLRFSVGPVEPNPTLTRQPRVSDRIIDWAPVIQKIDNATDQPIMIVYAPILPNITDGRTRTNDANSAEFASIRDVASRFNIRVVDVRDAMRDSVADGNWPHGFQNGQIGSGHLNRTGYRIIAKRVVDTLRTAVRRESIAE